MLNFGAYSTNVHAGKVKGGVPHCTLLLFPHFLSSMPLSSPPPPSLSLQLANAIGDAIRGANLNLNPIVEGNILRVPIPKPSKETRDASLKHLAKVAEEAKARVRRTRQAGMDKLKKAEGEERGERRE